MISLGNDVAVGVSGDGDEILNNVGWRRQNVCEEEGLKVGALGRAEASDPQEVYNDGLNKQRAVGEWGNVEDMEKVVPGLLAPQDADGEAGAPA